MIPFLLVRVLELLRSSDFCCCCFGSFSICDRDPTQLGRWYYKKESKWTQTPRHICDNNNKIIAAYQNKYLPLKQRPYEENQISEPLKIRNYVEHELCHQSRNKISTFSQITLFKFGVTDWLEQMILSNASTYIGTAVLFLFIFEVARVSGKWSNTAIYRK